ncbi:MAG: FKBP-type peptidyl-prolyl cis-trans isomerase [Cytophagaceae bacterium]|nr:FKBP-type peptidyl-prolyl cis-trans isomerase [Cytophagaceae bacterium]
MKYLFSVLRLLPFLVLTACIKTDQEPDAAQRIKDNEDQIRQHAAAKGLTVQRTSTGLYYVVTNKSNSTRKVQVGEEVAVHFVISRLDGFKLDSSSVSLNRPDKFPWGAGMRLPGLEEGLSLMNEGDRAVLLVPYFLAYDNRDFDILPAYSPVRYDVTLVSIRNEAEQIDAFLARNKLVETLRTPSGLRLVRTQAGTGPVPTTGQTVQVAYTGRLLNEVQFDIGTLEFKLGQSQSIKGFEEGIALMKVGEKATLVFPSPVAYGKDGIYNGQRNLYTIPPYAPLAFEVELKAAR